ncbi:MAG: hypothetical protein RL695_1251 [Pseudomonadota bacterium]|jgi:outer membrane protein/protease secretion system outer membrane protein
MSPRKERTLMKILPRIRKSLLATLCALALSPTAHAIDLLQAYRLAIQNDARYQAARAEAAASREAEPQAIAQLLPNVSANIARSDRSSDISAPNFMGKISHNRQDYISSNYAVTLRQPLYRRYNFMLYQQAQSQVASAEANLDRNLQDLLIRLSSSYFDALMAEDQLNLALAQKEAYAAQKQYAQRRFESGQGTRTDIDDTQARYDMALAQELDALQNLDYNRRQIQTIINQPVTHLATLLPARIELLPPNPADPEAWIKRSEDVNAELRSLRANIDIAEKEVSKAGAGHHPTIDLVAQRSKTESDTENTLNQGYLTTSVGIQISIPIFAGGYNSSQVRQAEAALDKARQQYEARRREIDLAVRKEYQNITQGILKVKALEQAERSADQAVYSNQKGYQAGTRTLVDILNAQQQRMNTRRDLSNARLQYLLARLKLQSLAGSLQEEDITAINLWLDKNGRDPEPEPEPGKAPEPESTQNIAPTTPATAPVPDKSPGTPDPEKTAQNSRSPLAFRLVSHNCPGNQPHASPFGPAEHTRPHYPLVETCGKTTWGQVFNYHIFTDNPRRSAQNRKAIA